MDIDLDHLKTWIGRTESRTDLISATPVQGLAAMLDRDEPEPTEGAPLPPGGHWLYGFTPIPRQSALGPDGHPARGGFLPPVPLPRRMWAGGRLKFEEAPRVGGRLERRSSIIDVSGKQGRSGALVFVKVRHEIGDGQRQLLVEEQDIVYRDEVQPGAPAPLAQAAPAQAKFSRTIEPDPVLLFRYSALTHNGHRIHYDRSWAIDVEGYPGLIVHGPLIATLLLDLVRRQRPEAAVASFDFRAVKPLFDIAPFQVCGRDIGDGRSFDLWAQDTSGALAMQARATLRD